MIFQKKTQQLNDVVVKTNVFTASSRAFYIVLVSLELFFLLSYIFWWFNPGHIPSNWGSLFHIFDVVVFALLSFVVFIGTLVRLGSWFALFFASRPKHITPQKGLKVAFLTCYVPGKEPIDMLITTLQAMRGVRYPHDTWVLDEGDSSEVGEICKILGVKHFSRLEVSKYNQDSGLYRSKTKAGNHNAWRDKHDKKYDIVAQIDMDHVPEANFFERTLGYFRDSKVGLVGMPQVYKNTDNWIARGAAEQSYFFHGPMQQGFYGSDMPFLIGTSHIYRVSAMNDIGGYGPTIVEDHLTGMGFYAKKWKGVFVPELLAKGEGPVNWVDYFNQQMRWSYGLFEILFKHTPRIIHKLNWRQKINYFLAQLYYFTGVAVFVGFLLTVAYLVFGVHAANMNLFEWIKFSFPPFILANMIQVYIHKFNIDPENEPIFGFLGMFLGLAANIIYAIAFFKLITGQELKYMVTQKGSAGHKQRVPLSTFKIHLILACIMLIALISSFLSEHGAIQLRFWAIFNIVIFLSIALSIYWDGLCTYFKLHPYAYRAVRYSVVATFVFLVTISALFTYDKMSKFAIASQQSLHVESVVGKIAAPREGILFGVSMYQHNDINSLVLAQKSVGEHFAIVGYYQAWGVKENNFDVHFAANIDKNGSIPMITWEPWRPVSGYDRSEGLVDQKEYRLANIIKGDFDSYITDYAKAIRMYGKPVMIRFAHEMNGSWYPWGSTFNTPQEYILVYRHVHEIFDSVRATNATWVFSPNASFVDNRIPYADNLTVFYPGDDYVDWVGFSAFNWAGVYKQNVWETPSQIYQESLTQIEKFNKPIMITETASAESPDNLHAKAEWINQFANYLNDNPKIKGVVWFNTNDNGIDWSMTSSDASMEAFVDVFKNKLIETAL